MQFVGILQNLVGHVGQGTGPGAARPDFLPQKLKNPCFYKMDDILYHQGVKVCDSFMMKCAPGLPSIRFQPVAALLLRLPRSGSGCPRTATA